MTKDQALDWLAWGIVAGVVVTITIVEWRIMAGLGAVIATLWASYRILDKIVDREVRRR